MVLKNFLLLTLCSFHFSHGMDSDDNGAGVSAAAAVADSGGSDAKGEQDDAVIAHYWPLLPFGTKQRIVEYATGGEGRSSAEFLMLQEVAIPNRELEEGRGNIRDVAYSRDGKKLASGSFEKTYVWDAQTGQEICTFDVSGPGGVAFSPDGNQLALASWGHNDVYLCDLGPEKSVRRLEGHTGPVVSVAFSPNGEYIASGGKDNTVRLWDPISGKEIRNLDSFIWYPEVIKFSPDGKLLAVGAQSGAHGGKILLWIVETGKQVKWRRNNTKFKSMTSNDIGQVWGLSFSPDGKYIASGSSDGLDGRTGEHNHRPQICLWNWQTREIEQRLYGHKASVYSVSHSSDGELLASQSGDGTVRLWDLLTKKEIRALHGGQHGMAALQDVRSVTFSPDDNQLACAVDVAKLRDLTAFNVIRKWFKDGCPLTKDRFEFSRQDDAGAVSQKYSKPVDPMRVRLLMEKLVSAYQMMRQAPDTEKETHVVKLTTDEMADWGCLPEVVQHVLIRVVKQVPVVAKKPERKCSIM